jgi:hypothetical protein
VDVALWSGARWVSNPQPLDPQSSASFTFLSLISLSNQSNSFKLSVFTCLWASSLNVVDSRLDSHGNEGIMPSELHEQLIEQARVEGWNKDRWKKAFLHRIKFDWEYDWYDENEDILEAINKSWCRPDAWRIVVEGPEHGWNFPLLILEFLEVEVSHQIDQSKKNAYIHLWFAFDDTQAFMLRVFRMDRFGNTFPYITENTVFEMMNQ